MSQLPYGLTSWNMPQPQNTSVPINAQSFIGFVQDGKIFRTGTPDGPQAIGVTSKVYEDQKSETAALTETCQEYYDVLTKDTECPACHTRIRAAITPEPTTEELIKMQAEQLGEAASLIRQSQEERRALFGVIDSLKESIAQLSTNSGGNSHEHDRQAHTAHPRPIPEVERDAQSGVDDNAGVQKQPVRTVPRPSGTKSKSGANKADGRVSR